MSCSYCSQHAMSAQVPLKFSLSVCIIGVLRLIAMKDIDFNDVTCKCFFRP